MAKCLLRVTRPESQRNLQEEWKRGYRAPSMRCASSGKNTKRRRIGYLSSLTRGTRSMRRTGPPCYGLSGISDSVVQSLCLTATYTGPHW